MVMMIINDDGGDYGGVDGDDGGDNNNGDDSNDDGEGEGEPLLLHRICQVIHDITSVNRDPKNLQFKSLGQTLFL